MVSKVYTCTACGHDNPEDSKRCNGCALELVYREGFLQNRGQTTKCKDQSLRRLSRGQPTIYFIKERPQEAMVST